MVGSIGKRMNELVSVIIPVYNTAKYLDSCMESVVNQTYQNMQIVLVDDGATDTSPEMCDSWAQRDIRIRVIHKENEGLGFTRNAGLNVATGKYVCFLDSDDTLDLNTIEVCVQTLEKHAADACFYGRKTQQKDGTYTINTKIPTQLVYLEDEVKREFAKIYIGKLPTEDSTSYIQASACCGMYRLEIIKEHNITFMSERKCLSEDTFFNLDFCKYAKKVMIIPENFYNYTYNANSITKSYNPNKINQTKSFINFLQTYKKEYSTMDLIDERIAYSFYVYFRHVMEYEIKTWRVRGIVETHKRIQKLCLDPFMEEQIRKVSIVPLDMKKRLFVVLFLRKQTMLLMLYYFMK